MADGTELLAAALDTGEVVPAAAYDEACVERDELLAQVAAVRDLADAWERGEAYACVNPHDCTRCTSFQRAVIHLRNALRTGRDR